MARDDRGFWRSVLIVFALVSVLWVIQLSSTLLGYDFSEFGNWPLHKDGLKGIIFSPFIHGSVEHLVSNTLPILVLLIVLLNAYPKVALYVLAFIHVMSGALVWLLGAYSGVEIVNGRVQLIMASPGIHIGISGIIYGVAAFLVASGIFRKDRTSTAIAIFVGLAYGGMVIGFLPKNGVSWQSHLYGAISGIFIAFVVRKIDLPPERETEEDEYDKDRHFFDDPAASSPPDHLRVP